MRLFRWLSSVAFLSAALVTIAALGGDGLAPPPLSFRGALDWAATREPIVAVFALLRVCALSSGAYLFVVVIVSGVVRAVDDRRGTALLDRVPLGSARGLLSVAGLGALSVTASLSPASAQASQPETVVIRDIEATAAATPADAVIRPVVDERPSPTTEQAGPVAERHYVIEAGDSMWSVAAAHLGEVTGRADLSDAEVADYWRAVMISNPQPNPDLLFIGQVLELPAIPS
jgi:hypothetical protein